MISMVLVAVVQGALAEAGHAPNAPGFDCVDEELERLHFLIGDWAVDGTYRLDGEHVNAVGLSTISLDLEGCLLIERFAGRHDGEPFREMNWFALRDGVFFHASIDTDHGHISRFVGAFDNGDLVLRREGNGRVMNEYKLTDISRNSFLAEMYLTTDSGETWEPVQTYQYRRKQP